jgi:hypothetical protein
MSTLTNINNCEYQFDKIPNEIILKIFSPREIACILPYVSKIFNKLANDNELWNSISIKFRTRYLNLDTPFDYNNAKLSYIMRNIEISKMFEGQQSFKYSNFLKNLYNLSVLENKDFSHLSKIDRTNETQENVFETIKVNVFSKYSINSEILDRMNNEINKFYDPYSFYWKFSTEKILRFMLEFCQNPFINSYINPFIKDEKTIVMIMKDNQKLFEKEYLMNKSFLDRIDLNRIKNNKPISNTLNNMESLARKIVNSYETALKIYKNSMNE